MSASSGESAGCSTGTSRSTCLPAAPRRAARPRPRLPACCTSASATSVSGRRSPSSATTPASATSSARACARRGASETARCAFLLRSCASSRWPSPRASRPGRSRAPRPTSRSSAGRSSASSRCGARRPTPSATRAASATTRCSTSTSPTCAWPGSSRCCTACATSSCRSCRRSPRRPRPDDAFVHRNYPAQTQRAIGARLAAAIGFDFSAGRLDEAAHPFASGFAPGDVRLTTREREDDLFAGLFAVLHEAGHGLYEQGLTGDDRGHVLRPRHLARAARVAVALLGEHGRTLARVLGAPPGGGQGGVPGRS